VPALRVRVVGTELPGIRFNANGVVHEPVHLGIQRGRDVIDDVPADRPRAIFEAEFEIGRQRDGSLNFLGPFAQGDRHDRFFYLSWGVKSSGRFQMFRRLKIRLGRLSSAKVNAAVKSGDPVTVRLRLTDSKGGPLCATPPATHIAWD
jgi:hypothetical protein